MKQKSILESLFLEADKKYQVKISDISGMNVNDSQIADYRIKFAKEMLGKITPSLSRVNLGNIQEKNPEYHGYTTASVKGDEAKSIARDLTQAAKSGKISSEDEGESSVRFYSEEVPDVQIFYDVGGADDSSDDELTVVVRPLEMKKELTVII